MALIRGGYEAVTRVRRRAAFLRRFDEGSGRRSSRAAVRRTLSGALPRTMTSRDAPAAVMPSSARRCASGRGIADRRSAYAYDGLTDVTAGLDAFDDVNAILFQWPLDEPFDCDVGGLLAIDGAWYDDQEWAEFRGRQYHSIVGADVVVNAGLECFFQRSPDPTRAAHELFAHELGHTLGRGHACGDEASGDCSSPDALEALMRA